MEIQQRLIKIITTTNWVLLLFASAAGFSLSSPYFAMGIVSGGLIVTVNFHLLARTLKRALTPPRIASHNLVLAKYYVRFIISGIIIFILIGGGIVHPVGLVIGLSVVVASIFLATLYEIKNQIIKEAV